MRQTDGQNAEVAEYPTRSGTVGVTLSHASTASWLSVFSTLFVRGQQRCNLLVVLLHWCRRQKLPGVHSSHSGMTRRLVKLFHARSTALLDGSYLETSSGSPRKHVTGPETTSSHRLICGDAPFVDSSHKSGAGTPDTPLRRSPGMPRRMLSIRPRPSPFQLPPCRCRAAGQRHSAVPDSAEVDRLNRAFDGDDSVRRHTRRNFSPHRRLRQPCTGIHRLTVTYFSSISMLAAFRRHPDGKTRRNVCYSVVTQIPFFCTLMIMWTFFLN